MTQQAEDLLTQAEFRRIRDMVHKQCGINLHEGKVDLVRARICKRLRAHRCGSASEYLDLLERDESGREIALLINEMSTNLTSFFREANHFNYLRNELLPKLLERKRAEGCNRLRFWSSACSTGQEPYTLAMTLAESIPDLPRWDLKILATDISTRVLALAEAGRYDAKLINEIPPTYRTKYVTERTRQTSQIIEMTTQLKSLIRFRRLNLVGPWPFTGPFDVIFCRNVLIYFDHDTQERLVNRFANVLDIGGLLITGHSESLNGLHHPYTYLQPTIYRKGHS